ncbi:MAG TPA: crossover junction endodeoxyribonuclease RuvC [Longimicrobium sp.]
MQPLRPLQPEVSLVMGVDPGTAVTGYGVVARTRDGAVSLVECGVIRTAPKAALPMRLRDIYEGLSEVIARHSPAVLAVEGVFYSKNVRTSVVLGHARGAVLLAAALRDVQVAEYPPAEVKSAVAGTGAATKEQVGYMVQRLLRLTAPPKPHDASDGVAVALCHCFRGFGPGAKTPMNLKLRLFDQGAK